MDKSERFYGPFGKQGWDAIESEIERQCKADGLSYLEMMASGFELNLETGEIKRIPLPK